MKRKLIALLLASSTLLTGFSWNPDIRKENGVFFETNDEQIIITGDGHIWDMENMNLENGNKVRVKFDTKGTEDKTDDEILKAKRQYIPRYSALYNLVEDSDGKHYILDLYQVESVDITETGMMYNFKDGTGFYSEVE